MKKHLDFCQEIVSAHQAEQPIYCKYDS